MARTVKLIGWVFVLAATGLSGAVLAQGGQGGGGFGGGGMGGGQGGGGFGGVGGRIGEGEGDTFSRMHILTPGERGEWPLKIEAGETIIARASSTNFDPYIQVVNSAGVEVAANDDIRPGEQDALVRVTFAKAGDYKILVKAFKSAGGGQYKFTLRRFTAANAPFSTRIAGTMGRKTYKWYQFVVDKDQTIVVSVRSVSSSVSPEVVAPNGETVDISPNRLGGGRGVRFDFRAREKGTYFLRLEASGRPSESFALTVAPARTFATKIGETSATVVLGPGGMDIWTFKGIPGEVVRVEVRPRAAVVSQTLEYVGSESDIPTGTDRYAALAVLPSNSKDEQVTIALLGRGGTYHVAVSQPLGLEAAYSLTISQPVKAWNGATAVASTLPVGGYDYYSLEAKAGQVVRMEALAEPFDITLALFNPRGERIAVNDDGAGGRNALLTSLMTEAGRYLVCISSSGDGGGGVYRLRPIPNPVHAIRIGEKLTGTVGAATSDIWSFAGRTGEAILLSVRSSDFDTTVRLFGPDGVEVASDDDGGDGTNSLLSVQLPVSGTYTIWVTPKLGAGKYTVRLLDAE